MVATILRVLGTETSVNSSGSVLGNAKLVRVYNQNASDVLITVTNAASTVTGTVTVKAGTVEYIAKAPTDSISAATACKMVSVGF